MRYLGLFFLILHLCGCLDVQAPKLPPLPAKPYNPTPAVVAPSTPSLTDIMSSKGWHDKALELQAQLNVVNEDLENTLIRQATLRKEVKAAKIAESNARDEERVQLAQVWLWSIGGICALLAIGCIALRQWPIIRIARELAGDPLLSMAKGFGLAAAACIALAFALAYLIVAVKWIFIGSIVLAVPIAGWMIYKYLKKTLAAEHLAGVADKAIATLEQAAPGTNFADKVKLQAVSEQIAGGIKGEVEKILKTIRA